MGFSVFRAIGETLRFAGRSWLDLLRILWLPMAVLLAVQLLLVPRYLEVARRLIGLRPDEDPGAALAALGGIAPIVLAMMAVGAVAYAMVFGGVSRLVLRDERPRLPFSLAFGADELRLMATMALLVLVQIGVVMASQILMGASAMVASSGPGPGNILGLLTIVATGGVMIWLNVRLSLATPATVARRRIGLGESWQTTEGRFWPLMGYWILWGLIAGVVAVSSSAILPQPEIPPVAPDADPMEVLSVQIEATSKLFDLTRPENILFHAVTYVVNLAIMGVVILAACIAWRDMAAESRRPAAGGGG